MLHGPLIATRLGAAAAAVTPLTILGSALVGWWNAEDTSLITIATGVSHWLDRIAGIDLAQATAGAQPAYSATSFGGRPGVTFDAVGTFLRLGSTPASFPIGNATCEIWVIADQTVASGTATTLCAFGYGASSGTHQRMLRRTVASANNRANMQASGVSTSNTNAVWFGRHTIRALFLDGAQQVDQDGVAGATGAPALATTAANVTMGASTAATAAGFYGGVIHQAFVVNRATTAAEQAALIAYGAARL